MTVVNCTLCGLSTSHPLTNAAGDLFCCPACQEVSALLAAPVEVAAGSEAALAFSGETETTTLSLSGMWCPSCAWLINERLDRTNGIEGAEVNFIRREALVTFDPQKITPKKVKRQIRRFGYGARLEGDKVYNEEESHFNWLLVSGVLVMHIMVLSFMLYLREWTGRVSAETDWLADIFQYMMLIITVPVILINGLPILRAGLASLIRGRPNTHTLIAIGSFAAFGLSVRNLIVGQGGVYFDTASILLFLVALGRWLELRAQKVSNEAVERLWQQMPQEATWLTPEGWQSGAIDNVQLGMRVRVRPGERFPVDALIAEGQGDVDESVVTGEPDPVARVAGEKVLAGTVNLDGAFEVIATAVGSETVVGQIGRLLHQALWQRAPIERMADKWALWLVPLAISLSALTFAYWSWQVNVEVALIHALSVLLIACPCALGIATPLTLWVGLGRATEAGIILRYTGVLEALASVEQVYFDKTGTLTKRPIRFHEVVTDKVPEAVFLKHVAAIEALSEHPMGQAIVLGAQKHFSNGDQSLKVTDFRALPGLGVVGSIENQPIMIGNYKLMEANGLVLSDRLFEMATDWQHRNRTVIYGGWDGRVRGLLGLGETLRDEVEDTLKQLKALGLSVAVLTGDSEHSGAYWQRMLNIPVHAGLRPEDKVERLGTGTLMVGDGINDGPALASADVGLAVNHGTDVAQSAAAAIMLHDDLKMVPWLIGLSRATLLKVRQNLMWAVVYNAVGLLLAVVGILQPSLAALLMVFSNLFVTTNALRLRTLKIDDGKIERTQNQIDNNIPILRKESQKITI